MEWTKWTVSWRGSMVKFQQVFLQLASKRLGEATPIDNAWEVRPAIVVQAPGKKSFQFIWSKKVE